MFIEMSDQYSADQLSYSELVTGATATYAKSVAGLHRDQVLAAAERQFPGLANRRRYPEGRAA